MPSSAWPDLWDFDLADGEARRDKRAVLFQLQTDLFVTAPAHDSSTIAAFEALALGFLPLVDEPTLLEVARRLAVCPVTPERVLIGLCQRSRRARDLVLGLAPRLPASLTDECIGSGPIEAAALSSRAMLDEQAQDKLLVLHDETVDVALAGNPALRLSAHARERLVERARSNDLLARTLLMRTDLNLADEAALYLQADSVRQSAICERIAASAALQGRAPPLRASQAVIAELVALAEQGNVIGFEAALTRILGLRPSPDWRFLRTERHCLLALALSAAGVPSESAERIFLTIHPTIAHSVRAVFTLSRVVRSVPPGVAVALVEAIAGSASAPSSPAGRHVPIMDPSGTPVQAISASSERRPLGPERVRRTG